MTSLNNFLSCTVKGILPLQGRTVFHNIYIYLFESWLVKMGQRMLIYYTPSIYAEGYIVFSFRLSIRMYVSLFVRSSITATKITSKFCVKVSQMGISQQPLIRKYSYLGHWYLRGSAYIP